MLGRYLSWGRMALLAAAIGGSFLVAQESAPVQGSHTRIHFSRAESLEPQSIVLFVNGPTEQVHVRVRDVDEPTGISAFEVDVQVPNHLVDIIFMNHNLTWLESTGRTATCTNPVQTDTSPTITTANFSCNTFNAPPPYGPTTASGSQAPALATLYLEPGIVAGSTQLRFTTLTKLVNTPSNPDNLAAIPLTRQPATIVVARCADFNGDQVVSTIDIVRQVGQFGTSNSFYDLTQDGVVSISDITISVAQFGMHCPEP